MSLHVMSGFDHFLVISYSLDTLLWFCSFSLEEKYIFQLTFNFPVLWAWSLNNRFPRTKHLQLLSLWFSIEQQVGLTDFLQELSKVLSFYLSLLSFTSLLLSVKDFYHSSPPLPQVVPYPSPHSLSNWRPLFKNCYCCMQTHTDTETHTNIPTESV